ncbi:MAG: tetratricopeptide repeat protein, partial [Spirochaetaceae bacterium]|nr:tetratricopeptide repeat protein [Spirochaetaceae bacterium]
MDDARLREALEAGRRRDYRKAIEILEPLAAGTSTAGTSPGGTGAAPEVFLYLGRSWHAKDNPSRAIQYLKIYIRLCPDDGAGWFFLGRSYLAAGRYPAAISALKKSFTLNSNSLDALGLLAAAYLKARNSAAALRFFELALTLAPDSPQLNQGYRNALFIEAVRTLRRGEAVLAAQMFSFLLRNGQEGVPLRLYSGHALRDSGQLEGALAQYQAACAIAPEDTSLVWYVISALFSLGRRGEADALIGDLDPGEAEGMVPQQWTEQMADVRIMREHVIGGKWQNAVELGRLYI